MSAQSARLLAMLFFAAMLAGCPDSKLPKVPTAPKVPEPKVNVVPSHLANATPAWPASRGHS